MNGAEERWGIGELAEQAGVSRRTVRYYVQQALLPPPVGRGRGSRYGTAHLERLLRIKGWQEAGLSLAEVRRRLDGAEPLPLPVAVPRTTVLRYELAPGVVLEVAPEKLPDSAAMARLAELVRETVAGDPPEEES